VGTNNRKVLIVENAVFRTGTGFSSSFENKAYTVWIIDDKREGLFFVLM
jgi:hypothetical protein